MRSIVYVTSSKFKIEECRAFCEIARFKDGVPIGAHISFEFRSAYVPETLDVDLEKLVTEEAVKAYKEIRVPCIVEHAGLIFEDFVDRSYPGGLTKAMWNALEERFVDETRSPNRRARARAVVAYCNGKRISTYVGETQGLIVDKPRGNRKFYWDTVFMPDTTDPEVRGMTYAEIGENPALGLKYKMNGLSQSAKALLAFSEDFRVRGHDEFWPA